MNEKNNYQFLFLQVIGIILVVTGHMNENGGIILFSDWFPPYSFHMPLFIFISGYFYKISNENNLKKYFLKKTITLLLPYFIWNLIYGIINTILIKNGIIQFGTPLSFQSFFIDPWLHGHQFTFNLAAWFVIELFIVQIIYVVFRKINSLFKLTNDYIFMLFFLIIGLCGVFLANKGLSSVWYLPIYRTMFLIPFFHLGFLYKTKLEKHDIRINNVIYFLILFIIQFLLIRKYNDLGFNVAWSVNYNKTNILLPFLTSITGIMFWLRVAKILEPSIAKSKIVNYIGNNTWTIMMHHLFIFFVINTLLYSLSPIFGLNNFNEELYRTNIWYSYVPGIKHFLFFYVIAAISIPLLLKYSFSKIYNEWSERLKFLTKRSRKEIVK